jgi:hypothetical protein
MRWVVIGFGTAYAVVVVLAWLIARAVARIGRDDDWV